MPAETPEVPAAPPPGPERFAYNLSLLEGGFRWLRGRLAAHQPVTELVWLDHGDADIRVGDHLLYGGRGARTVAEEQIAAWRQQPVRCWQREPRLERLDDRSRSFVQALTAEAQRRGIPFAETPERLDTGHFLVVFGVGLAPHLDPLVDATDARCVILVEHADDFLYHSLFVHDWGPLVRDAEAGRRRLVILVARNVDSLALQLKLTIRETDPAGWDGSVLFTHLPGARYEQTRDTFVHQRLATGFMGLGFFNDELVMLEHTYRNLLAGPVPLLGGKPRGVDMPVVVAGAGPSLQAMLPVLKEQQDRAVIVACGTAVRPLLANGVVPDFCVLLERNVEWYDLMADIGRQVDLSRTCLVASTTVPPGTAALFGRVLYFFRSALASTPAFCRDLSHQLHNSGPLVGNTGLAFAQRLGTRQIILAGMDLGSREPTRTHVAGHQAIPGAQPAPLEQAVPGNLGGTVYSEPLYLWAREVMEAAIGGIKGIQVVNASDGVRIAGARPQVPARLRLPSPAQPKQAAVAAYLDGCAWMAPEQARQDWQRLQLRKRLWAFAEEMRRRLHSAGPLTNTRFHGRLMRELRPDREDDVRACVYRGSLILMLACLHYYMARTDDAAQAEALGSVARSLLDGDINHMRDQADTVMAALDAL